MANLWRKETFRVYCETAEEWEALQELTRKLGFRIPTVLMREPFSDFSHSTRLFELDLGKRELRHQAQPFIAAAMASFPGIRFWCVPELLRLAERGFRDFPRFPVFHVPHDGRKFPEELMASVCIPREEFLEIHETMRDTGIARVRPKAYCTGSHSENFEVSRLLCDVERFLGPEEPMEQYGMGFCYERAYDGRTIKRVTPELREKTLEYYRKHHARMDAFCEKRKRILLFDLHSYRDVIVPRELLPADGGTPDLCIGADPVYTPERLVEIVRNRFSAAGLTVAVNSPYSGTFVPGAVLRGESDCDCVSIMLEFHKRTYCDETWTPIPERQEFLKDVMKTVIADCVDLK